MDYFSAVEITLLSHSKSKKLLAMLSEQTFLSAAVALETLLSDLFIAYINRKPSTYTDWLKDQISKNLTSNYSNAITRHLNIKPEFRKCDPMKT